LITTGTGSAEDKDNEGIVMHDFAIFIGRFQIFHAKHESIVHFGLIKAKQIILVLGSHDSARTIRNPFTTSEREHMVRGCFSTEENDRIHVVKVSDYFYNDNDWVRDVQEKVRQIAGQSKCCLLGTHKDHTSYYLDLFPQWPREHYLEDKSLSATDIREDFLNNTLNAADPRLSPKVYTWLTSWKEGNRDIFDSIVKERDFIKQYKAMWANAPFPVTFVTTDAVVFKSRHVLMIRRGHNPGKGLLALPGGFLEQNITLLENALKELKEETRIAVSKQELRDRIVESRTFDHPQRSDRGRTVSTAFLIVLPRAGELPQVKGGDDAASAMWVPITDVYSMRSQVYEDHFHMINYFYGRA